MPKLSAAELGKRRDHILAAAMRCFEVRGIAASSVDEICAEGNISKGAFYTHFESKTELIRTLLQRRGEAIILPSETLEEFETAVLETLVPVPLSSAKGRVEIEGMAACASDPVLSEHVGANIAAILEQLTAGIRRLETKGLIRLTEPPEDIAEIFHCFFLGKMATQVVVQTSDDAGARENVRALLRAFLRPVE